MIYVAVGIAVVLIAWMLAPFWIGPGGLLQASAQTNSPEQLEALKEALVKRYLDDEAAYQNGSISERVWRDRSQFLTNRYIDAARRLDFLRNVEGGEGAGDAVRQQGGGR